MRLMSRNVLKRMVAVLSMSLVQGCGEKLNGEGDAPLPSATPPVHQQEVLSEEPEPAFGYDGLDSDAKMRKINDSVPGFGGLFLDKNGSPTLFLKEGADPLRARTRLEPLFRGILEQYQPLGSQSLDIRILPAQYQFKELVQWRAQLRQHLTIKGVSRLGVDESKNRVKVGIVSEDSRAQLKELLASEGIPADAVNIEVIAPLQPLRTLRDKWWPPPAGMQVSSAGPRGYCSLGYNVYHYVHGWSFITASHCTLTQGGTEGTRFSQPSDFWSYFDYVGTEAYDPDYSTGGNCSPGHRCRQTDTVLVKYDTSKTYGNFGKIAMPYASCSMSSNPPIYCDPELSPYFYNIINSSFVSAVIMGQDLHKIGQKTGQTHGPVTDTCYDTYDGDSDVMLFCQNSIEAGNDHGDSGGPIFLQNVNGDAQAIGTLWGGSLTPGYVETSFGLMWHVRYELGNFAIRY